MNDELLDLVHALRAAVELESARGRVDEEDPPLPSPSPIEALAPGASKAEPVAPARPSGWEVLAKSAREEGPSAAAAMRQVREELGDCRRCPLCRERRRIVFGVGDPDAELVVVGEAPGYQEDLEGEPFVGPAGQMLDRMLENVLGLQRSQVYILNVVKCRPPKNRNPDPQEIEACRPFLEGQLRALHPKVMLVLGSVACRALLGPEAGVTRARGRWHEVGGVPAMPTFHPAYLLRTPEDKRLTFADLKAVKTRLDELRAS